jgi:hypothetical protein
MKTFAPSLLANRAFGRHFRAVLLIFLGPLSISNNNNVVKGFVLNPKIYQDFFDAKTVFNLLLLKK